MRALFCLLLTSSFFFVDAQQIHLRGGSMTVPENLHTLGGPLSSLSLEPARFNGHFYGILQFHSLPDRSTRMKMEVQGIRLLHYLPKMTFLAVLPTSVDWAALQKYGVRGFLPMPLALKVDPSISFPHLDGSRQVQVHFYAQPELNPTLERAIGHLIPADQADNAVITVKVDATTLEQWARVPFVFHIAPAEPERELESYPYTTSHRSNFLSDNPGMGLNFTGEGIVLGVKEGKVDDAEIDFQGRLDVSQHTGSLSGHATGVARIMAGAGNEDPLDVGMAYGSDILSDDDAFYTYYNRNAKAVNNSYGWGCNWPGYSTASADNDQLVRDYGDFMIVYSAGNIGGQDCGYGAGPGWGNITGSPKMAKNVIATGALDVHDNKMAFSSVGPATDGRIKPDMCAVGPGGTSHACPGVVGTFGQLYEAYYDMHGTMANGSLLKAILQNTAEDLGNPGPDFKFGYGRINGRRAYNTLDEGRWFEDSIQNGVTNPHTLNIPAGTKQLRLMLYWADYPGTPGAATALVNDLDLRVTNPIGTVFKPWVLDPTPNPANLNAPAVRAVDTLNNMEQVTIDNPGSGTYTINVEGTLVPQGPQSYFIVYELRQEELVLTHPVGSETFVPGETEIIRWDAYEGTGNITLEFSADSGQNWQTVSSSIPANQLYYDWIVPDSLTGGALIRISQGNLSSTSPATFSILEVPANLNVLWACHDSLTLIWDSVPEANGYTVFKLGSKYMDSIGHTSSTHYTVYNAPSNQDHWFSVRAHGPLNATGRRAVAIKKGPGNVNCVTHDVQVDRFLQPKGGQFPSCAGGITTPLTIRVLNSGVNTMTDIPVAFQINGGPLTWDTVPGPLPTASFVDFTFPDTLSLQGLGTYVIKAFTNLPGDQNVANDTSIATITIYYSAAANLPYLQTFDGFNLCSTAWGCEEITCQLTQGWFNAENEIRDSIDWRTNSGGTATANTGPGGDHTSGSGKYLYLETSGNGGSGCQNKTANLISPCFDLTQTNKPELSYWANMYGSSIGELHIDALVDGNWQLDIMAPISGDQGSGWFERIADLSPLQTKTVVFRFRGTTGPGYRGDMALDDINVSTLPTSRFTRSDWLTCPGQTVTLTDQSWYADSRQWIIGPGSGWSYTVGSSDTSQQPVILISDTGSYTVTLITTNARGSDTLTKTIHAGPHHMLLSSDHTPAWYCLGSQAIFTADYPAQNYQFFVDGQLRQSSATNTFSISNLVDGQEVQVTGTVSPGCPTDTAHLAVGISQLKGDIQVNQPVLCYDSATAILSVAAWNYLGSLQYNWSTGAQTPTIQDLPVGTYYVTVTDEAECEIVDFISLIQPTSITTTLTTTPTVCFGDSTGSITITSMGGTGSHQYAWSTGDIGNALPNVPAGFYSVTTTDQNGCTHLDTIRVEDVAAIHVSMVQVTGVACYAAPTGGATVAAMGGNGPYTYHWSNGQTGTMLSNVSSGPYGLTVSDSVGCELDTVITVPQIGSPITITFQSTSPACHGDSSGTIQTSVQGAQGDISYEWSNGNQTDAQLNVPAGLYILTVTDTSNCIKVDSVELTEPTAISVQASTLAVRCHGEQNGAITLNGTGGTGSLTYSWSDTTTGPQRTGLAAGWYTFTAEDQNLCAYMDSAEVTEPDPLVTHSLGFTDSICPGTNTGYVSIEATGGTPGYAYYWSNGAPGDSLGGLSSGIYGVTVTDTLGCTHLDSAIINSYEVPVLSVTPRDSAGYCPGDSVSLEASPGFAQYTWSNGGGARSTTVNTSGKYLVTGVTHQGCQAVSDTVVVFAFDPPTSTQIDGKDTLVVNEQGAFTVDGDTQSGYDWFATDGSISGQGTTVLIAFDEKGVYTIKAVETTADGCAGDTIQKEVIVTWPIGIARSNAPYPVRLYPNPTNGSVQITGLPLTVEGQLLDVTGRQVRTLTLYPNQVISLHTLPQGVYMLTFEAKGNLYALPIMKQ